MRKVKFLKSTFPQPGTALLYLEKRARSDRGAGAGRAAVWAGGSSWGSWKLLAALGVCFLEGNLFVGVFVGTCEEMGLESNRLWPLWCRVWDCQGALFTTQGRCLGLVADPCPSWADRIA